MTFKRYWPLILIIVIYLIFLVIYFINFNKGFSPTIAEWGAFGDFLGGSLSPLIGIVTIILTYSIIVHQFNESQQGEFKNIFQIFFDSIPSKQTIIEIKKKNVKLSGQEAIFRINKDIEAVFKSEKNKPHNSKLSDKQILTLAVKSVNKDINGTASPYINVLNNCLNAIENHCLEEHKKVYCSMVRSQLHKDELIFIFYNSIASEELKNLKNSIEKNCFLQDLKNHDFPIGLEGLKALYNRNAFYESSN